MIFRRDYIEQLGKLRDKHQIKVLTGVRYCGKTTILHQYTEYLWGSDVEEDHIILLDFSSESCRELTDYKKLHEFISSRLKDKKMYYLMLDDVCRVKNFQKVVASLFMKNNVDIYITGSNAQIFEGTFAALLGERFVEIHILPLSFGEYMSSANVDQNTAWEYYKGFGGFPFLLSVQKNQDRKACLQGIMCTVLMKEVLARKKLQDVLLMEQIINIILMHTGEIISAKRIADELTEGGRKTTSITVESYVSALEDAYLLYKVGRYDIKKKESLKSLEKYYMVDPGLGTVMEAGRQMTEVQSAESIVMQELRRRGFGVKIGKLNQSEIDFIATKGAEIEYYQVMAGMGGMEEYKKKMTVLCKIADNYPKHLILTSGRSEVVEGIKQINITDFLQKTVE